MEPTPDRRIDGVLGDMRKHLDNWVWFDDGWLPERAVRYDAAGGGDPLQTLGEVGPPPLVVPEVPPVPMGPYRTRAPRR